MNSFSINSNQWKIALLLLAFLVLFVFFTMFCLVKIASYKNRRIERQKPMRSELLQYNVLGSCVLLSAPEHSLYLPLPKHQLFYTLESQFGISNNASLRSYFERMLSEQFVSRTAKMFFDDQYDLDIKRAKIYCAEQLLIDQTSFLQLRSFSIEQCAAVAKMALTVGFCDEQTVEYWLIMLGELAKKYYTSAQSYVYDFVLISSVMGKIHFNTQHYKMATIKLQCLFC